MALANCLPVWACFLMEKVLRMQQALSDAENEIKWRGLNLVTILLMKTWNLKNEFKIYKWKCSLKKRENFTYLF